MIQAVSTIAIIDPDASACNNLSRLVRGLDVNVTTYPDAETFLAQLNLYRYDCLISETCLPGIGGIELLKQLKALGIRVPTILLTRQTDISLAVQAMQAGAVDYIQQPFIEPLLIGLIRKILSCDNMTDQLSHSA